MILIDQIKHCKICFEPIKDCSFHGLFFNQNELCESCFSKFKPKFIHFDISGVNGLAIYEYDQTIKDILFKFKGCYDIELKDTFLSRYYMYLKWLYAGYVIVPLPSYHIDDEVRGFNHVEEIYNRLNLPIIKVIEKYKKQKQATSSKKVRKQIINSFKVVGLERIKNKKVLIVDDVLTTGSSVKAAIKLVKAGKPKKIKVLVIAKNRLKDKNDEY